MRSVHVVSIVARVPLAMLSLAVLVHAIHLTGSYGAAGVVSGAYAGSLGLGAPLLGRLVDRRGQTAVLLVSAGACMAALGALAALRRACRSPRSWRLPCSPA
jgi:MFS family permease